MSQKDVRRGGMAVTTASMTKTVKVPVLIPDEDKELRILKYKALDRVMQEAQFLGNLAIRYAIAFNLKGIQRTQDGKNARPIPLDTQIYRILAENRTYLNAATVATLGRNFALKAFRAVDREAWAGHKSLPTFRAVFVPFRSQDTAIREIEINNLIQFVILPSIGRQWLTDELLADLGSTMKLQDGDSRLVLRSRFSWKDKKAANIVTKITTGEYRLCDSQIRKDQSGLHVLLAYRMKIDPLPLDLGRICGVTLGVSTPMVCAINSGPQHLHIGKAEDVWAVRSKFRAERIRKHRRLGLVSRKDEWRRSEKEDRWNHHYCHDVSRQAIRFCLTHGCGKIHMDYTVKREAGEGGNRWKRILGFQDKLFQMLFYKAREVGIEVVKINGSDFEYLCSACEQTSDRTRPSGTDFLCSACGQTSGSIHVDLNRARNIARATDKAPQRRSGLG